MLSFPRSMRKKSGFTLIELLVVIAIIAILAAILFPVFAQARAKARQTSCLSNSKQMGLAMLQYVQDYDEYYPLAGCPEQNNDPNSLFYPFGLNQYTWQNLIQPYTKNYAIFVCPDSGMTGGNPVTTFDSLQDIGFFMNAGVRGMASYTDYWWNTSAAAWNGIAGAKTDFNCFLGTSVSTNTPSANLSILGAPSTMTMLSEGGDYTGWTDYPYPYPTGNAVYWTCGSYCADNQSQYRTGGPLGNHLITGAGSYNKWTWQFQNGEISSGTFCFCDGHAKSIPMRAYMGTRLTVAGQRVLQYLWPPE